MRPLGLVHSQIATIAACLLIISCSQTTERSIPTDVDTPTSAAKLVDASYYGGPSWKGKTTASGEKFDAEALTAAHRTLPFGTRLRVTNPNNGKSVIVRINDRGPFIDGRSIDLSLRAAREIGIVQNGITRVEIKEISERS